MIFGRFWWILGDLCQILVGFDDFGFPELRVRVPVLAPNCHLDAARGVPDRFGKFQKFHENHDFWKIPRISLEHVASIVDLGRRFPLSNEKKNENFDGFLMIFRSKFSKKIFIE